MIAMRHLAWGSFGAALVTTSLAVGAGLAASSASAVDAPVRCGGQSLSSSTDKKCLSPSPSPTPGQPQGNEVGCRDLLYGAGQFRGVGAAPSAGAAFEFLTTYDAATCPEVSYTVIVRDMDTYSELGRHVQQGNGSTDSLVSAMALPGYAKDCIAADVIVSEGAVVHDIGPNSRDLSQPPFADLCRQGATGMAWN